MVTQQQLTTFYTGAENLSIPVVTYVQLQEEGLTTFEDLLTFKPEDVKRIAEGLRRPSGRIPDPTAGAAAGATIPTPPFPFPTKSQIRLEAAIELAHFYDTVGRAFTAQNMMFMPIMKNFKELWDALQEKKKKDEKQTKE